MTEPIEPGGGTLAPDPAAAPDRLPANGPQWLSCAEAVSLDHEKTIRTKEVSVVSLCQLWINVVDRRRSRMGADGLRWQRFTQKGFRTSVDGEFTAHTMHCKTSIGREEQAENRVMGFEEAAHILRIGRHTPNCGITKLSCLNSSAKQFDLPTSRRCLGEASDPIRLPHLSLWRDLDLPALIPEPSVSEARPRIAVWKRPDFQHRPC